MKHFEPAPGIVPAEMALAALEDRDFPLSLPAAAATPLDRVRHGLFSESARVVSLYDYHVFHVEPQAVLDPTRLNPDARLFTYEEILAAPNVTESTRIIAQSFVGDRRVAVAVIVSRIGGETRFLLVRNRDSEFFFPATRMKTKMAPELALDQIVRNDLASDDDFTVVDQSDVPLVRESARFGWGQRRFHFTLCLLRMPNVDPAAPGNSLERSLDALQAAFQARDEAVPGGDPAEPQEPYWGWFTAEEIRTGDDIAPTARELLLTALQLADRNP